MAIPRSYFRLLTGLALDFAVLERTVLRQKLPLSSSCVFRQRLAATSRSQSRAFSTTPSLSKKQWVARQLRDPATLQAKVLQYKSRAAIKLLEIDDTYKLFSPGMTVVDLGFAPGSWSQVAADRTDPGGRVIGIDLLPAQPPKRVSSIQGNFLDPGIQASVRKYLSDPNRGRPRAPLGIFSTPEKPPIPALNPYPEADSVSPEKIQPPILQIDDSASMGYIAQERRDSLHDEEEEAEELKVKDRSAMTQEEKEKNTVDVVLSDMCEPWPLTTGWHMNTVLTPWRISKRLMNTSGVNVRDHAGSMQLCAAALTFCVDVLKPGGSFVCKFYQGTDDKKLEQKIKQVFAKVVRMKPDSSRPDSKECYWVATKKLLGITRAHIQD